MSIEAMKLALEALEDSEDQLAKPYSTDVCRAITALRQAIEQAQKQEPVAWVSEIAEEAELMLDKPRFRAVPLYTSPPQRQWVGLTDDEVREILNDPRYQMKPLIVHAVEAKLKEKNT